MVNYTPITEGGTDTTPYEMYIRLYPNTANEEPYVDDQTDEVPDALITACDQLVSSNAIDYYKIYKWAVCDTNDYPDTSSIGGFRQWLENGGSLYNNCGENLTDYVGTHLLVGDYDECSTSTANATTVGFGDNAFVTGCAAITPSTGCNQDQIRASAIQETLHNFINWQDSDVRCEVDCSASSSNDNKEHALGEINSNNNITPMLTYHYSELEDVGKCSYDGLPYGYTDQLTACAKEAVKQTWLTPV